MKRHNDKTGTIGIIITIVILIILIIVSNLGTSQMKAVQTSASKVFMPFQNMFVYVKNKITKNDEEISNINSLKQENQELKQENSNLKEAQRKLEILKSENNTLKEYLNLKEKYGNYETKPANVIERTYSNYDKIVVINIGEKDGIAVNMPVISESGLVGHVISVTDSTAKVQTILDTASTVSANISTSEQSILAKGTLSSTNMLRASSIPAEATILQGDEVTTSGLGGIYQKGILIGTISEIVNTKNEVDRYCKVQTATDFDILSTVLVITNSQN